MRALFPHPSDTVDLVEAYAPPRQPGTSAQFVRCNMISSVDGAISVHGLSGPLGGPPDRRIFQVLRSWADVIVVGAGTARTERYGPVRLDDDLRALRAGRGQPPVPPVAVVTGSGDLDWSSSFFSEAEVRPIVATTVGSADRVRHAAGDRAEVVDAGTDRVDPSVLLRRLAEDGQRSVLVEGGPGLNADMVHAGLLDELCLTLSPNLVGGSGPRVFAGQELTPPLHLATMQLLEEDGFFFWRLAFDRAGRRPPG